MGVGLEVNRLPSLLDLLPVLAFLLTLLLGLSLGLFVLSSLLSPLLRLEVPFPPLFATPIDGFALRHAREGAALAPVELGPLFLLDFGYGGGGGGGGRLVVALLAGLFCLCFVLIVGVLGLRLGLRLGSRSRGGSSGGLGGFRFAGLSLRRL